MKALHGFRAALKSGGADAAFMNTLDAVLTDLDEKSDAQIDELVPSTDTVRVVGAKPIANPQRVISLSPKAIERIASRPDISRKQLEAIAVNRFQVPQGSLRSWGTIDLLKEKILTMARNEQVHQTIADVARGSGDRLMRKE